MANAPILKPSLHQSPGTSFPGLQRSAVTDGANTFTAGQWVANTSGALVAYAAGNTALYGLSVDASQTATAEPYNAPYGEKHNVIAPSGQLFVMNLTDASGTVGSGVTTQATAVVGTSYAGIMLASPYTTTMGVNLAASGTTGAFPFRIVALHEGDATGDFNGRVIVSIAPVSIQ